MTRKTVECYLKLEKLYLIKTIFKFVFLLN